MSRWRRPCKTVGPPDDRGKGGNREQGYPARYSPSWPDRRPPRPFTKSDDARRRAIAFRIQQLQFGCRRASPTIGRGRTSSSARAKSRRSSDAPSWNGEVFAIGVASGPKWSPPRWNGTRADRTIQAALGLHPHFRLQLSGSARWSQRQATLVHESIGQQHLHTKFRGG